jgi:outer membrane protein assembly factor BamB
MIARAAGPFLLATLLLAACGARTSTNEPAGRAIGATHTTTSGAGGAGGAGGATAGSCGANSGFDPGSPWPTAGRCASRPYTTPVVGPATASVKWKVGLGAYGNAPVIGADGTIYLGAQDGDFRAIDPADGSTKWRVPVGWDTTFDDAGASIGADGTVFVGADALYAIDPRDGTVRWRFTGAGGDGASHVFTGGAPAIAPDGTLFIHIDAGSVTSPGDGSTVYALDPATGKPRWATKLDGELEPRSQATLDGAGHVLVEALADVIALDVATGARAFTLRPALEADESGLLQGAALADDGRLFVAGVYDVYGFDAHRKPIWTHSFSRPMVVSRPTLGAGEVLYVLHAGEGLHALSARDGTELWWQVANTSFLPVTVDGEGTAYVGDGSGTLHAMDAHGKPRWNVETGAAFLEEPAVFGDDGTIYAVAADTLVAIGP